MALWKNGKFTADPWRTIRMGEDAPPSGHVIVPLEWWKSVRDIFLTSNVPVGVRLEPDEDMSALVEDISRLSLIALSFPAYTDGRSFSRAQLLRERHGFSGELRAVGEVLIDQLHLLERSGFDAFEITNEATARALHTGKYWRQTRFYQPAATDEIPAGTRPWLRQAVRKS